MANYINGIVTFPKNEKAPDFVIGGGVINIDDFKEFINENKEKLTDYKGKKQLKFQMLKSDKGNVNFVLDEYKKREEAF